MSGPFAGRLYTPQEFSVTVPPDWTRQFERREAQGHCGGLTGSKGGSSKGCTDDKFTRRLLLFSSFWPQRNLRLLLLMQTSLCLGSRRQHDRQIEMHFKELIWLKLGPDVPFDSGRIRNFGQIKANKHNSELRCGGGGGWARPTYLPQYSHHASQN